MTVIIAVSTLLVSVATFFIGCCFTAKKTEGEAARALRSDLGYIKSSLDDIKRKQEQQEANHIEMMAALPPWRRRPNRPTTGWQKDRRNLGIGTQETANVECHLVPIRVSRRGAKTCTNRSKFSPPVQFWRSRCFFRCGICKKRVIWIMRFKFI